MEGKNDEKKYTTISIPTQLAEKIKKRIHGTGFTSISSYVTYVLREVVSSTDDQDKKEAFSKEDEEKVKERLRAVGYLD